MRKYKKSKYSVKKKNYIRKPSYKARRPKARATSRKRSSSRWRKPALIKTIKKTVSKMRPALET